MVNNNNNIGVYLDKAASYVPFVSTANVGINLLEIAVMNVMGIKDPKNAYLRHVKNKPKLRLVAEAVPFGNFAGLAEDIKNAWGPKSKEKVVDVVVSQRAQPEPPKRAQTKALEEPRPVQEESGQVSTPRPKLTLKSASTVLLRPFSARPQGPIGSKSTPTGRMRDVISTELGAIDRVAKKREDLEQLFSQGMQQLELGNRELAFESIQSASRQGYIPAMRQYALMVLEQPQSDKAKNTALVNLKIVTLREKYDKNNELTETDKVAIRQANGDLCKLILQGKGEYETESERYDAAKEHLDKAQDSELDYVYQYLGQKYYDLSEKVHDPAEKSALISKSKECLEKAKIRDAYYELASIYLGEGNRAKAIELYQQGNAIKEKNIVHAPGIEPEGFSSLQIKDKLLKLPT